jgi:hypothetical protein
MTLFRHAHAAPARSRAPAPNATPESVAAQTAPAIRPVLADLASDTAPVQRMKRKRTAEPDEDEEARPIKKIETETGATPVLRSDLEQQAPESEPEEEGPVHGPAPSREMLARRRLQRAKDRQKRRMADAKKAKEAGKSDDEIAKLFTKRGQDIADTSYEGRTKKGGNRLKVETPFGTGHVGKGVFKSMKVDGVQHPMPFVKLDRDEWDKRTALPKDDYNEWHKGFAKSPRLGPMLGETLDWMSTTGPTKPSTITQPDSVKMAGTALATTSTAAEQHFTRNPDGGKLTRSAFRRARRKVDESTTDGTPISEEAKGQIMSHIFNRTDGAYVPAWATSMNADAGGTSAYREMIEGTRSIPEKTVSMIEEDMSDSSEEEHMSDSSDEEEPEDRATSE